EDTPVAPEEMAEKFGPEVAALVDGVTKLTLVHADLFGAHSPEGETSKTEESLTPDAESRLKRREETLKTAANLRKIFLAMAKDLRVMIIKLADRMHNMRTLDVMPPHKRKRIAKETLEIFAPLAHRLGIWQMKWELEDLAFKYAEPEKFGELAAHVAATRDER